MLESARDLGRLRYEGSIVWHRVPLGPEMPLIGGSERDFTGALEAVDSELAKNTDSRNLLSQMLCKAEGHLSKQEQLDSSRLRGGGGGGFGAGPGKGGARGGGGEWVAE